MTKEDIIAEAEELTTLIFRYGGAPEGRFDLAYIKFGKALASGDAQRTLNGMEAMVLALTEENRFPQITFRLAELTHDFEAKINEAK